MVLHDDAIDEIAGGVGQHESGNPIDSHQQETKRQQASAGANQVPDYGENNPQLLARLPGIAKFARGTHLLVRLFWRVEASFCIALLGSARSIPGSCDKTIHPQFALADHAAKTLLRAAKRQVHLSSLRATLTQLHDARVPASMQDRWR